MTSWASKWLVWAAVFGAMVQGAVAVAGTALPPGTFVVDPGLSQASINAKMIEALLQPAGDGGSAPDPAAVFARITGTVPTAVYKVLARLKIVLNPYGSSITMNVDGTDRDAGRWRQNGKNLLITQANGHLVGTVIAERTIALIIGDIVVYFTRQDASLVN